MIKAILFDLDDTLLGNEVYQTFIPAYYKLLTKHMAPYLEPDKFVAALNYASRGLIGRTDMTSNNRELFWGLFEEHTGLDTAEMEPIYSRFCEEQFPKLRSLTQRRPIAATLVQACLDQGLKVVVATNPLFPQMVIEQRLAWAGVPASDFSYDLITSYENMHSAKPNPAYYAEILEMIHCGAEAALMVGDSWENDIVPAASLGLFTYWVDNGSEEPPDGSLIIGRGSLDDFYKLFMKGI